jgi:hypothetical protein
MRHSTLALAGLTLACLAGFALAQQPAQPAQPAPAAAAQPGGQLAGLAQLLSSAPVRKQLGFTDEQTDQLRQAFENYYQQQPARPDLEALPQEQQRQKIEQYQQEAVRHAEQFGQRLAQILTDEQKEQLQQITFRMTAFSLLTNPQVVQQIGLSEDQMQKLEQIREEMQAQMWQLQEQAAKQSLQVLSAEELTKLRNFLERGLRQQTPANGPAQPRPDQPQR